MTITILDTASQDGKSGGVWVNTSSTTTVGTCSMTGFIGVTCTIFNFTTASLTFSGVSGTVSSFDGRVGPFKNPDSVQTVNGILINLISGTTGEVKATATTSLSGILARSFTVSLKSSS
jgi:hypothetical protein